VHSRIKKDKMITYITLLLSVVLVCESRSTRWPGFFDRNSNNNQEPRPTNVPEEARVPLKYKDICSTDDFPNFKKTVPFVYNGKAVNSLEGMGPTPLIINGKNAKISEFPHQFALLVEQNNRFFQICGGSLIAKDQGLTAAHCVDDENKNYYIAMGVSDLATASTNDDLQIRQVERVRSHEDYINVANYDIAVLKLVSPMQMTSTVKTIARQRGSVADTEKWWFNVFYKCHVSGWGDDGTDNNVFDLQSAQFKILSNDECEAQWRQRSGISYITDGNVCVSDRDSTPCFGDSGGPLTCKPIWGGAPKLVGVVSWGSGECMGAPTVFTRTSAYRKWVDINQRN